jgi:glucokinase
MKHLIGIDIGGTNTELGIVAENGQVLQKTNFKTQEFSSDLQFVNFLSEKITQLTDNQRITISGIGIGAPNGNFYTGRIENAPNIKWAKNVPLVRLLKEKFKLPVKLTNDANAAAIGEKMFGKAKKMDDFILITLGTGLGSGLFVNGKIVHGHSGFAGEMGHINAVPGGRLCGCGKHGCLETYVSATGIRTTVLEMLGKNYSNSILQKLKVAEITAKTIYEAAEKGDQLAKDAFDFTAKILGEKLADIAAILSPEAIFIAGGLSSAGNYIIKPLIYHFETNIMETFKNKIKIEVSGIKENVGISGAAALLLI